MRLVNLDSFRLLRSRVLELILLRWVPEDRFVSWRDREILYNAPAQDGQMTSQLLNRVMLVCLGVLYPDWQSIDSAHGGIQGDLSRIESMKSMR